MAAERMERRVNQQTRVRVTAEYDGPVNGRDFGFAIVLAGPLKGEKALCPTELRNGKPPLGRPFDCLVERNARGWRVISLVAPETGRAVVESSIVRRRWDNAATAFCWTAAGSHNGIAIDVIVPQSVLEDAGIADVQDGTVLRLDVEFSPTGGKALRILAPSFVPPNSTEVVGVGVVTAETRHGGAYLLIWRPGEQHAVKALVGRDTLRAVAVE